MKVLRRFFTFVILLLLLAAGWGYYMGMRPDNYKEFISELISPQAKEESSYSDLNSNTQTTPTQTPKPKSQSSKNIINELQPLPPNPFASIDKHARACPASVETDPYSLAEYLEKGAQTDLEKARAIYVWLTDNVVYDDENFNSGNYINTNYSAEAVLVRRTSVCDGFSNLFLSLGEAMELEVERVVGYSKGYGYTAGATLKDTDHAWNAVKIDGEWRVFDATWGAGHGSNVNGKLVSTTAFDDYWFNLDPYEAIFNHYPEEARFASVQPLPSLKTYSRMPNIRKPYFKLGFDGKKTYSAALANPNLKFPEVYGAGVYVEVISAPQLQHLKTGQTYKLKFYIPRGLQLAVIDAANTWTYFASNKGTFELSYSPQTTGELKISVKHDTGGDSFHGILRYQVKRNKPIS